MHQEHAIPWNKVASHFQFVVDNVHFTPRTTGLFPRGNPSQAKDLEYFRLALTKSITDFSATERKKYDKHYPPRKDGLVFSEELKKKYFGSTEQFKDYLNDTNQSLEYWISSRHIRTWVDPPDEAYETSNANLAEVIKILLAENQMPQLLMLAHHPKTPIEKLDHLSWGHHFGFSRVMESALQGYILINMFAATGVLDDGRYLKTTEYGGFIRSLTEHMDYPAQVLVHHQFLDKMPVDPDTGHPMLHKDYNLLKEYVKMCFALLYRYDLLLRELGTEPDWARQITGLFECGMVCRGKVLVVVEQKGDDWSYSFV